MSETGLGGATTEVLEVAEGAPQAGPRHVVPQVDLLPLEILEERVLRRAQRSGAVGVGAALAVVLGVYAASLLDRAEAAEGLSQVQARGASLTDQQAQYAAAPRTEAAIDEVEGALTSAMASEVLWQPYLAHLSLNSPQDLWFTRFSATAGAAAAQVATTPQPAEDGSTEAGADPSAEVAEPAAPAADPTASPLAPVGIGTLTVAARAGQHPDTAAWLEVLDATPGLAGATFTTSSRELVGAVPVIDIESSAVVTADALSHRYDAGGR